MPLVTRNQLNEILRARQPVADREVPVENLAQSPGGLFGKRRQLARAGHGSDCLLLAAWLFKLFVWSWSPFGLTEEYFDSQSWKLVERFHQDTTFEEVYGGLLYISAGTAPEAG